MNDEEKQVRSQWTPPWSHCGFPTSHQVRQRTSRSRFKTRFSSLLPREIRLGFGISWMIQSVSVAPLSCCASLRRVGALRQSSRCQCRPPSDRPRWGGSFAGHGPSASAWACKPSWEVGTKEPEGPHGATGERGTGTTRGTTGGPLIHNEQSAIEDSARNSRPEQSSIYLGMRSKLIIRSLKSLRCFCVIESFDFQEPAPRTSGGHFRRNIPRQGCRSTTRNPCFF